MSSCARSVGRTEGLRSSCVYKMRDRPRPQPARPSSHAHTHRTRKKAVWGCQGQHSLNGSQLVFLWIKPTKQRDNRPTTATATTITFAPLTPAPAHVLSLSLTCSGVGHGNLYACLEWMSQVTFADFWIYKQLPPWQCINKPW